MALLDQVQEERNTCRVELAAANERIDAGDLERNELRREVADLRTQVSTLQAYHSGH
jgi:predicted  nucleic acid-binding Zn-ribbon protein